MHFLNPHALWLLLVAPPLVVVAVWVAWRRKERLLSEYGERPLLDRFSSPLKRHRYLLKGVAAALSMVALIVAIARPSFDNSTTEYPVGTTDVICIVDVSRSMAIPDYRDKIPGSDAQGGTRLDMARYLITSDVIPSLGYNRVGVVTFSGDAFPQAFLTDDLKALRWVLLRAMTQGSAPGEGSNLAGALNMAGTLFDMDSKDGHRRMVVIFSDGGNDSEMPDVIKATDELKKRNVELIVVGLGSKTPHAIPISQLSPNDRARFSGQQWYTADGQVVTSALDENTLLYLKNAVGGRYVHVQSASDFHIGNLTSRADVIVRKGEREVFYYPLLAGLLLAIVAIILPREFGKEELIALYGRLRSFRLPQRWRRRLR